MDLNQIKLNLRPRNQWAAVDLGIMMVRNWWMSLYLSWIAITLPVYLAIVLLTITLGSISNAELALFVFWWLKPLWERSHLFILSRVVFGEKPSIKQIIKEFPRLFIKQIIMSLTIRRFSPYRSFDLSVIQLENLAGKARRKRLRILHSDSNNGVIWTMLTCIHIESILLISSIGFLLVFIPDEVDFNPILFLSENNSVIQVLTLILGYFSMTLIAPVYLACGFSSYLNRRTILEGWDIELVFRNIKNLHQNRSKSSTTKSPLMGKTPVIILFLLHSAIFGIFSVPDSYADDPPQTVQHEFRQVNRKEQAKERIEAVIAGPDFHSYETKKTLNFRYDWFKDKETKSDSIHLPWLKDLGALLANIFEYILWSGLVALVIILITVNRRELLQIKKLGLGNFLLQRKNRIKTEDDLLASPESDLHKIPEKALALWREGEYRKSLGLLYRSTLQVLVKQYNLDLTDSLTEEECVRLVSFNQPANISQFFTMLTRNWQKVAYGHRIPESSLIESINLQWLQLFSPDESR